jgi:Holliday junction resolvasome RuvABC endonuclease subunit
MQKIDNKASCFDGWFIETVCIEIAEGETLKTWGSSEKCNRYLDKVMKILCFLGSNLGEDKIVGIEHYSYNSRMSSSFSTLMELGGLLRTTLSCGHHDIREISPSAVKKMFGGVGKATKDDMYNVYKTRYGLPDLNSMIGIKSDYAHVPHPVEDMVDAVAVAIGVITTL